MHTSPENKQAASKAGAVGLVIEVLTLGGGSLACQCAAAVTMCALTEGKGALVAEAAAAGASGPLAALIWAGGSDPEARGWAARAVQNIVTAGEEAAVEAVLEAGAGEALAAALRHAADTGLGVVVRTQSEGSEIPESASPRTADAAAAAAAAPVPLQPGRVQREQQRALNTLLGQTGAGFDGRAGGYGSSTGGGFSAFGGLGRFGAEGADSETAQLLQGAAAAARLAEDELAGETGDDEVRSEAGDFLLQGARGRVVAGGDDGAPVECCPARERAERFLDPLQTAVST